MEGKSLCCLSIVSDGGVGALIVQVAEQLDPAGAPAGMTSSADEARFAPGSHASLALVQVKSLTV